MYEFIFSSTLSDSMWADENQLPTGSKSDIASLVTSFDPVFMPFEVLLFLKQSFKYYLINYLASLGT
jgi:hypothetical protein